VEAHPAPFVQQKNHGFRGKHHAWQGIDCLLEQPKMMEHHQRRDIKTYGPLWVDLHHLSSTRDDWHHRTPPSIRLIRIF
jgi:hypothetical protein